MPRFQPGDPLDEATVMGAIVDATQMKTVMGYIEAGKAAGAKLLAGGAAARRRTATAAAFTSLRPCSTASTGR